MDAIDPKIISLLKTYKTTSRFKTEVIFSVYILGNEGVCQLPEREWNLRTQKCIFGDRQGQKRINILGGIV